MREWRLAAVFFVDGVGLASWAPRIPQIKSDLALSDGRMGLALLAVALGSLPAMPTAGALVGRFGSGPVTRCAAAAYPAALVPLAFAGSFPALAAALFVLGSAAGALDVAMNAHAVAREHRTGVGNVTSLHGAYSLGALSGGLLGTLAAATDVSPRGQFLATSTGLVAVALAVGARLDSGTKVTAGPRLPRLPIGPRFRPVLLLLCALAFGVLLIEGVVSDWGSVYLAEDLHAPPGVAAAGYTAFVVAMAAGRFAGDRAVDRFGARRVVRGGAILAGGAAAAALLSRGPWPAVLAFALIGLGIAASFPLVIRTAGGRGGGVGTAVAAVSTAGYLSALTGPALIGFLTTGTTLGVALVVLPATAAAVALLAGGLPASTTLRPAPAAVASPLPVVPVGDVPIDRLASVIGAGEVERVRAALHAARDCLDGRRVWHVSVNPDRGGVAEILRGSLPSQHAAGIRVQWAVLAASPEFTAFTKSLYYSLCGVAAPEVAERLEGHRPLYEATCRVTADRLAAAADPADLIVLHDHQAAGLAPFLRDAGHPVLWRMHVGPADDHARARHGWAFLSRYTAAAHASVSSAPDVLPPGLATAPNYVLAPAIDPLSAKNRPLGTAGEVARLAAPATAAVPAAAPLVTQVSRWDRVKDIPGVIRAFADHVDPALDAHLALVGPDTRRDPPAQRVFGECRDLWTRLGAAQRARVHLVQLPTGSRTRHALTVNALQRRSAVIVQNSRAEGFGLTVTEAAWKGRPVVASAVGGLRHQVEDGRTGLLARPGDPGAFGQAVERVLRDPAYGEELGHAARDRVRTRFLPDSHLLGVARVLTRMSAVR